MLCPLRPLIVKFREVLLEALLSIEHLEMVYFVTNITIICKSLYWNFTIKLAFIMDNALDENRYGFLSSEHGLCSLNGFMNDDSSSEE